MDTIQFYMPRIILIPSFVGLAFAGEEYIVGLAIKQYLINPEWIGKIAWISGMMVIFSLYIHFARR